MRQRAKGKGQRAKGKGQKTIHPDLFAYCHCLLARPYLCLLPIAYFLMYTELHLHTAFSFLDGASLAEEMIGRALELGYQSLAVTDHDGLYGAMEFAKAADDAGIFPITGAEMTLTDESHITLLASSPQGYANLSRLITEAHRLPPDWQSRRSNAGVATGADVGRGNACVAATGGAGGNACVAATGGTGGNACVVATPLGGRDGDGI
ncbi:MAG: PHP domain-containing protein, partial [Thermomicrobiales bacterium]